jgi:c-di-AMP phosphodiesterase-like protein
MSGEKQKNKVSRLTGRMKFLLMWPVAIGVLLLVATVGLYFVDVRCGVACGAVLLAYIVVYVIVLLCVRPSFLHELYNFASEYSQVQRQMFYDLDVPYALADSTGHILWMNRLMQEKTGKGKRYNGLVESIFPEIEQKNFPDDDTVKEVRLSYNERDYRVELKKINIEGLISDGQGETENSLVSIYMFDETDINSYVRKIRADRFVVGLIYIDNYEDALDHVDDIRRSLFAGLIDKRVNKYFTTGASIVRKLEKDKYIVVFKYQFLEKLMADKFSLLEDIKTVKIGNDMTITLSIGIGTGTGDYAKSYDSAKSAMDLALGRGGDQAVVKDGDKTLYYGGKSQQQEKNTRVKVRVKAHALRQILETTENVLIMGHKLADIDSFGSAIGIYVICQRLGKDAHIVINNVSSSVKPFMDRFRNNEDYPEDMFLTREEAPEYVNKQTAVIVVDVNKADRTECPELLTMCKTIIVFDHHRQSSEPITGAVLSYVDPYASSAAEMITEMIQYVEDGVKIKPYEADALYAGISIDTDGFQSKSGPRTFEAVAFLRRHGADITRVRKMLRDDMECYVAVAQAVSNATVYRDAFAITIFDGEGLDSPTIGGAKAANQLLDISGIKASFVVTKYNDVIYISARSIDEVNVQLVMEKFGGGGHMTIAGAQLRDCSLEQAIQTIKNTLDAMIQEGDI